MVFGVCSRYSLCCVSYCGVLSVAGVGCSSSSVLVRCLLFVIFVVCDIWLLVVVCCLLSVGRCSLHVVCCLLFGVCCWLFGIGYC